MTTHDRLLYGSFAGHIELREDMLRHAGDTLSRSIHLRNAIGIATALFGVSQFAAMIAPETWLGWLSSQRLAITCGLAAAWVLATANVWVCRQRFDDCRDRLMEYVSRLPT